MTLCIVRSDLIDELISGRRLQVSAVSSVMMLDSNKVGWNGRNVIWQLCDEASNAEQCEADSGNNDCQDLVHCCHLYQLHLRHLHLHHLLRQSSLLQCSLPAPLPLWCSALLMTEQIKNERAGNIFGGNQTKKLNIENTLTEHREAGSEWLVV